MSEMHIKNAGDLKKWLSSLPEDIRRQVAVAIAARAALRILPALEVWLHDEEEKGISIVLPVFRATATSWVAAMGGALDEKWRKAALHATNFAHSAYTASSSSKHAASISSSIAASRAAVAAVVDAFYAPSSTLLDAVRAVSAAVNAANEAAPDTFTAVNGYSICQRAVQYDAQFIVTHSHDVTSLTEHPLWLESPPDWTAKDWDSMKARLLAREGEHWEVWTDWYEARLHPDTFRKPCYNPPVPELERARVLLPDDLWKQGPAAVNAKIRRLIEEHECSKPPAPEQMEGVQFEVEEDGRLEVRRQPPENEESNDPLQQQMFRRIRQKLAQLSEHMATIGNQYPDLADIIRDYDEAMNVESLAELDVPTVWMTGLGLVAQAEAFEKMDGDAITPRLEPEVEGLLKEVAGLHGAFITGFRQGRKLVSRSIMGQLPAEALEKLKEAEERFLTLALTLPDSALGGMARNVIGWAKDQILLRGIRSEEITGKLLHVPANIVIVIAQKLEWLIASGLLASAMGPEGIQAWLQFLQAHGGVIAAIAQTIPELRVYLRYLYDKAGWDFPEDGQV